MTNVTYRLKIKKGFYDDLKRFVDHHIEYLLDLDAYPGTVTNATITSNNDDNTDVTINFDFEYDECLSSYECDYETMIDLDGNPEILEVCAVNIRAKLK